MIPFTFDEETHIYKAPGWFVLGTSDVLSLNKFVEYGQVPKAVLDNARERGQQVHKAIEWFETDAAPPTMPAEVEGYFRGWLKFREQYDFEPVGVMEKKIVYAFGEEEHAIGATIDARGIIQNRPYVLDIKCTAKQSGKAAKQKALCWRMQLQSYWEATATDEAFWEAARAVGCQGSAGRAIVHLFKDGEFTLHDFSSLDDSENWAAAVRVAQLKLRNGFDLERRE